MKQLINFISSIILALVLNACLADMDNSEDFGFDEFLEKLCVTYQNVCPSVTDAIERPEPWNADIERTFVIPDETIRSMSTCGLLETYLRFPEFVGELNNFHAPGITIFNDKLRENKVAIEFFSRSDFYPVLVSKYLSVIKVVGRPSGTAVEDAPIVTEWLLASDLSMSAMNQKEKIQLMVMALQRTNYAVGDFENHQPCLIMIAIMKSCEYGPFMKDIEPRLVETTPGYTMVEPGVEPRFIETTLYTMVDGHFGITSNILTADHRDTIIKYARQFLSEQKIIAL